jgi:hypothetical protein
MVAVDIKSLAEVTLSKETILSNIWGLEQDRIKAVETLAAELSLSKENCSLLDIAKKLDADSAIHFRAAHETLKLLLEEAKELNSHNMRFASESLERIELMKRNILGVANPVQDSYNAQGNRQSGATQGGRLLSKEA